MQNNNIDLYNKMRNDFFEKFHKVIIPKISPLEKKRKQTLILTIIITSLLVIVASALKFYVSKNSWMFSDVETVYNFIILIYAIAVVAPVMFKKNFEQNLKEKAMPTVCKCFENLEWNPYDCETYNNSDIFLKSCLTGNFTDINYDDIFKGSYKDVGFDIVECKLKQRTGERSRTVFQGVVLMLDMNKKFNGHTVIKPNIIIQPPLAKGLKYTELEDSEFNKKFKVYTDDEVEARYLITPSFMERLKNLKTVFAANQISCTFYKKHLGIALSTSHDLFSLGNLIKPVGDEKQFVKMFEEILSIIKLIDHFKLNEKTGL